MCKYAKLVKRVRWSWRYGTAVVGQPYGGGGSSTGVVKETRHTTTCKLNPCPFQVRGELLTLQSAESWKRQPLDIWNYGLRRLATEDIIEAKLQFECEALCTAMSEEGTLRFIY